MSTSIERPYVVIPDVDGQPLDDGYVYIGEAGLVAEANAINVFWDEALSIPAAQPIRTINGFYSRNGSPGRLYVAESDYSVLMRNKNNTLVYSALTQRLQLPSTLFANVSKTFPTVAAMIAAEGLEVGALVRTTGYTAANDGGGAQYIVAAPQTVDGVGDHILSDGNTALLQSEGPLNVKQYGAAGDGVADDTTSIFAAFMTEKPVFFPEGDYFVTDGFDVFSGQSVKGVGRHQSRLIMDNTFNLDALGVLVFESLEPGPEVEGLGFIFKNQPDSATLADYVEYPPAIYAQDCPRFSLKGLHIRECYNGIDMTGNSGGAILEDIELSAFRYGIEIDGSLDSIKISKLHIWPFGFPGIANKRTVFSQGRGISCGRADDFQLLNSLIFSVIEGAYFYTSAAGSAFGTITGTDFDDRGGLHVAGNAKLYCSSLFFSLGKTDARLITQTDGILTLVSCRLRIDAMPLNNHAIQITGGTFSVTGSLLNGLNQNANLIYAENATVLVNSNTCQKSANANFTLPLVRFDAGTIGTFIGNIGDDLGVGGGPICQVVTGAKVTVTDNHAEDWSISLPNGALEHVIADGNIAAGTNPNKERFAGSFSANGTSRLDLPPGWLLAKPGPGNYAISHNLNLTSVRDIVFIPVGEGTADISAQADYANSTTNQIRIRTKVGGVAADADVSFMVMRRR